MAKRSEKSKWPSRYSIGEYVSEAQYITEFICENKARSLNKDLPTKFWQLKEWEKFFRQQIPAANKLLTKYPAEAIIRALQTKDGRRVFSLRAPHLPKLIEAAKKTIKTIEDSNLPGLVATQSKMKTEFTKPNLIDRLNALDG